MNGLTYDEEVYYANFAYIEDCDDIGHHDYVPIFKDKDHNYMIFDGKFICMECRRKYD